MIRVALVGPALLAVRGYQIGQVEPTPARHLQEHFSGVEFNLDSSRKLGAARFHHSRLRRISSDLRRGLFIQAHVAWERH